MKTPFFVTTPIYYSNGIPHIGHSYSSLIADVLARHRRMSGFDVKFSTGVDENSQKVVEKAAEAGLETMAYADLMAGKHREVWDGIGISYTDFVRTTASEHMKLVQEVLQKSFERGDIYEGEYEGMYCVGCEAFKKQADLTEAGKCPDHPNMNISHIKEKNWFFRLSKYEQFLKDYYRDHPDFVIPLNRFAEVKEFVNGGLEDFSISRETNKFGIPLPFDPSQVTYVWYDALFNYVSVCQGEDTRFWPADLHVVGKDIIRFHAIYWPAMLESAGYAQPKNILTTGHFTIDGQKISKSLGNVIEPVEFSAKYSRDMMLLYLLSAFPIGGDGDFSEKEAILAFNSKLANNIGNLLNRFIVLSLKIDGKVSGALIPEIANAKSAFIERYSLAMDRYDLRDALAAAFDFGDVINKYVDTTKPWEMKDESQMKDLENVLFQVGEALRTIAIGLSPFFGEKMNELLARVGAQTSSELLKNGEMNKAFDLQTVFSVAEKGDPLYMRIPV